MGDFIGFGTNKSQNQQSSQDTSTTVNTTTSTTVRDIGLTGQNAVDLAGVMGGTELARSEVFTKGLDSLFASINNTFGTYVSSVESGVEKIVEEGGKSAASIVGSGERQAATMLTSANNATGNNQTEMLKLAMLGVAAIAALFAFGKR